MCLYWLIHSSIIPLYLFDSGSLLVAGHLSHFLFCHLFWWMCLRLFEFVIIPLFWQSACPHPSGWMFLEYQAKQTNTTTPTIIWSRRHDLWVISSVLSYIDFSSHIVYHLFIFLCCFLIHFFHLLLILFGYRQKWAHFCIAPTRTHSRLFTRILTGMRERQQWTTVSSTALQISIQWVHSATEILLYTIFWWKEKFQLQQEHIQNGWTREQQQQNMWILQQRQQQKFMFSFCMGCTMNASAKQTNW